MNAVPVAELFAVLGVDSSQFDDGLRNARVNLDAFLGPVLTGKALVNQLTAAMGEAAVQELDWAAVQKLATDAAYAKATALERLAAVQRNSTVDNVIVGSSGGSGTGLSGSRQAAVEIEAIEGSRFGIARLLSMLPAVQAGLEAAFAPILTGVLIYGFYELGSELNKLIIDWEGFGNAAQVAWSKAEVGEQTAITKMIDYQRKMEEAKGLLSIAGEQGHQYSADKYRLDAEADAHTRSKLVAQQTSIEKNELVPLEKRIGAYDRFMESATVGVMRPTTQAQQDKLDAAMKESKTILEDRKTALALHEKENEISAQLGQMDIDKINKTAEYLHQLDEIKNKKTAMKKEHDPVHELPYRLPWFMGSNPATDFLGGGKMTPGPNPGAPWRAPISIQNTHHITIQGGDSSSIKDAIPDLLDALENNSNGSMARLSDILRDSGIAPSV